MADGLYYNDCRPPWPNDVAGVDITLSTTDKAILSPSQLPVLGGNYFNYVGKKVKFRMFGKITTAATPGNGTWDIYYGDGTDANGTVLGSSAAKALQANQTTLSWVMEFVVTCTLTGSTGKLAVSGWCIWNVAVMLSTAQPQLIPDSALVTSAAIDLTASKIISPQFKRSGSTAEHMWCQDWEFYALN